MLSMLSAKAAAPGVQLHFAVMADGPCRTAIEHFSQPDLQQNVKPFTWAKLPRLPSQAGPTSQPWLCSAGRPLGAGAAAASACAPAAAGSQKAPKPEHTLPGPQCESVPRHWEWAPQEEPVPEQME